MNGKKLAALLSFVVAVTTALSALLGAWSSTTTTRTVPVSPIAGRTITHDLGGPGDAKVALSPDAQAIVAAQAAQDKAGNEAGAESGLRDKVPPTAQAISQVQERAPPGQGAIPQHVPLATVSQPGCTTALVRNYSARPAGARVLLGVLHWTGSTPTRGSPAGGAAIVRWFDDPRAQASSNYVTDQDGRCWLTVAETQKAWTQAAANPWSVSDEITNAGVQPIFQTQAAENTVIRLMISWHHRWGLPYRYAKVDGNCVPTRSGFLEHRDLGRCGGGHPDLGTYNLNILIRLAAARDGRSSALRAKHQRTHQRLRKNHCTPKKHGYCDTLRSRNGSVHRAAKRAHVSLAGTYR